VSVYPGAEWLPGRNAGYAGGQAAMTATICHYTVGRDSTGIGLDGYFTFLVSRDGHIKQFCEADALCWHAGEANWVGPGIEIEFLDEPEGIFTDAARDACGGLLHWLHDLYGIPLTMYDGDRIPPEAMREFVTHRSVLQSQGHSNWWPREDWDRMVAGAPGPGQGDDDDMKGLWIRRDNEPFVWLLFGGYRIACGGKGQVDVMAFSGMTINGWDDVSSIAAKDFDEIPILEWTQTPNGRYVSGPPGLG
jgi:N-acetylmuramoyl-L-alanine amidase